MSAGLATFLCVILIGTVPAWSQELGGAGTIQGTVKDPTGGIMQAVTVRISNAVTGFARTTITDTAGRFVFRNIPPNGYRLEVEAQGFTTLQRVVEVQSAVPIDLDLKLSLAGTAESVSVVGHTELVEADPTAHTDVDQREIERIPLAASPGLNQIITLTSPGVVADSNGFFHPIGDHAQTQFSIDNQPITDQQSRLYSNQISQDAVQSMELITGVAPAEYGDKTSLVVHIVTKSGLDQPKPTGTISAGYGTFKSPTGDVNIGGGTHNVGEFASFSGLRTDRYLDTPEFDPLHANGNLASFFDRVDLHPDDKNSVHLNVQAGRSDFDMPNTYDQVALGAGQHQRITSVNIAPGYTRIIGSNALFSANGFYRHDHLTYTPSANPLADQPGTFGQDRTLTNYGIKADVTYTTTNHNVKVGGTVTATPLHEIFQLGITNPSDPTWAGPDGNFDPRFAPFDLTNGGSLFNFDQSKTIKQQAVFIQDEMKTGDATIKAGVRLDRYDGLVTATQASPRVGLSYSVPGPGTVLRASYGRTMETPYNENLLLSAGVGLNGLFGTGDPLPVGKRNEIEVGGQQAFGRWLVADVSYYDKWTDNGYDFNVLFGSTTNVTSLVFPIAWSKSHVYGFAGRLTLLEHRGFSANLVMATTNAIYSPPSTGGIQPPLITNDFRIDHDQKFNSTVNLQYAFARPFGAWGGIIWRYDSGLVPSAVPDVTALLGLDADQQAAAGLYCGSQFATLTTPITSCSSPSFGATNLRLPAPGTENDVSNPPRVAPRHEFDLGLGADNLLRGDKIKVRARLSVVNLANNKALYNFLSTFTGTHWLTPRAVMGTIGVSF